MTDQRLRDGGPWYCSEPQVHADGYQEDFGHQDATDALGPTCNGVPRVTNPAPASGRPSSGVVRGFRSRHRDMPRLGEKVKTNEGED